MGVLETIKHVASRTHRGVMDGSLMPDALRCPPEVPISFDGLLVVLLGLIAFVGLAFVRPHGRWPGTLTPAAG